MLIEWKIITAASVSSVIDSQGEHTKICFAFFFISFVKQPCTYAFYEQVVSCWIKR